VAPRHLSECDQHKGSTLLKGQRIQVLCSLCELRFSPSRLARLSIIAIVIMLAELSGRASLSRGQAAVERMSQPRVLSTATVARCGGNQGGFAVSPGKSWVRRRSQMWPARPMRSGRSDMAHHSRYTLSPYRRLRNFRNREVRGSWHLERSSQWLPWPFILNNQNTFTLPLGVQAFASQYSVDTAKVLAFASLSMIPALVFFSERRIVGGLTGAVKG
jgi:hypothetical protein